jgi:hypothetical protein
VDHIVPKNRIAKMDQFDKLTEEQMLIVMENRENLMITSAAANTSRGDRTFAQWKVHARSGTRVKQEFLDRMKVVEKDLEIKLQAQIDDFVRANNNL